MDSVRGFSLCKCPGETTQQPVILGDIFQLLEQQPNNEVVRDELPLVHEGLGQHPDFCVPSHVVSDQIPTGEGLQLEVFGNEQHQGALAGARGAHHHGVQELPPWPHGCQARPGVRRLLVPRVDTSCACAPAFAARHPGRRLEDALLQRVPPRADGRCGRGHV